MIQFILNKSQTGNATPARVNLALNMANSSLFKRYNNIPESWQPGQPMAKMMFSESADIEKVMRLFKRTVTLYINDDGITNVPDDFIKESTLTYATLHDGQLVENEVLVCNDAEFQESKTSYVVPATLDNPTCNFIQNQIRFLPKNLINVDMTYLRMPVTPVWAFTLVSNRPVYDANNSVQPEWPDDVMNDYLMLAVQYLGVNAQKQDIIGYAEQYKQGGQ